METFLLKKKYQDLKKIVNYEDNEMYQRTQFVMFMMDEFGKISIISLRCHKYYGLIFYLVVLLNLSKHIISQCENANMWHDS